MDFTPFPKIPRLRREITITEKLDGTNASITILPAKEYVELAEIGDNAWPIATETYNDLVMLVGSRKRYIRPGKGNDNFGFAQWVEENGDELFKLGIGTHFGEWWGQGIQRGYGLHEKRFSLFNTARPPETLPECVSQVPLLYRGIDDGSEIETCLDFLRHYGSPAAPSFMEPEGVVVYHSAARSRFKVLLEGDDIPKGNTA